MKKILLFLLFLFPFSVSAVETQINSSTISSIALQNTKNFTFNSDYYYTSTGSSYFVWPVNYGTYTYTGTNISTTNWFTPATASCSKTIKIDSQDWVLYVCSFDSSTANQDRTTYYFFDKLKDYRISWYILWNLFTTNYRPLNFFIYDKVPVFLDSTGAYKTFSFTTNEDLTRSFSSLVTFTGSTPSSVYSLSTATSAPPASFYYDIYSNVLFAFEFPNLKSYIWYWDENTNSLLRQDWTPYNLSASIPSWFTSHSTNCPYSFTLAGSSQSSLSSIYINLYDKTSYNHGAIRIYSTDLWSASIYYPDKVFPFYNTRPGLWFSISDYWNTTWKIPYHVSHLWDINVIAVPSSPLDWTYKKFYTKSSVSAWQSDPWLYTNDLSYSNAFSGSTSTGSTSSSSSGGSSWLFDFWDGSKWFFETLFDKFFWDKSSWMTSTSTGVTTISNKTEEVFDFTFSWTGVSSAGCPSDYWYSTSFFAPTWNYSLFNQEYFVCVPYVFETDVASILYKKDMTNTFMNHFLAFFLAMIWILSCIVFITVWFLPWVFVLYLSSFLLWFMSSGTLTHNLKNNANIWILWAFIIYIVVFFGVFFWFTDFSMPLYQYFPEFKELLFAILSYIYTFVLHLNTNSLFVNYIVSIKIGVSSLFAAILLFAMAKTFWRAN